MRRMIRADIRRILKKVMFYGIALIAYIIMFTIKKEDTALDQMETIQMAMELIGSGLFPIAVFIFVYGDELKAGVIHSIIGRGLSRSKVVAAKYIDCLILLLAYLIPLLLIAFLKNSMSGLPISPKQSLDLFWDFVFMYVRAAGYMAFGSMGLFLTVSVAGGMVTLIVFMMVIADCLKTVQGHLPVHVYDLYFEGLVDKAQANFMIGKAPWQLVPAIGIYIIAVLFLTGKLFERKELDL